MLRGAARFTADLPTPSGTLCAVMARCWEVHGERLTVDATAAQRAPDVVAVVTAAELALEPVSFYPSANLRGAMARPPLATDKVRFAGEPVAVVLAETHAQALDAAELVELDVEPLPVVLDPLAAAQPDAPLLFEQAGTNVVRELDDTPTVTVAAAQAGAGEAHEGPQDDDPCAGAATVVELVCENPRAASVPIEPCAIIATPEGDIHCTGQGVHRTRDVIARALGVKPDTLRVRFPAVGGGFGGRADPVLEFVTIARCAQIAGRPVRWTQSRAEQFVSMPYGRAQTHRIRLGLSAEGDIVGLDVEMWCDAGAYPHMAPMLAGASRRQCTGMYRVPRFRYRYGAAATNAHPVGAYRGAGQPEVNAALERAIDAAARAAGLDPTHVRRRNLLRPDHWPYETDTGITIDSGEPVGALDAALDAIDAQAWRAEADQRKRRGSTHLIGIGVGCYSQTAGSGDDADFATVEMHDDGTVTVRCGSAGHGQAHASAWAKLVSRQLGVAPEAVSVVDADTQATPAGQTTGGSRTAFVLGSQVHVAAAELRAQLLAVAARLLEAAEDDLVTTEGGIHVAGVPTRLAPWADVAAAAEPDQTQATCRERQGAPTHPYGTHATVVEVDTETGGVSVLAHAAVDDAGTAIDADVVAGQQHGGAASGISQALFEAALYAPDGTPQTLNLVDYPIATADSLPMIEVLNPATPTPRNPLGARGIGENGAIAAPPAVQNAVVDALAHLGVTHVDIPLSPERVWQAISAVRHGRLSVRA